MATFTLGAPAPASGDTGAREPFVGPAVRERAVVFPHSFETSGESVRRDAQTRIIDQT